MKKWLAMAMSVNLLAVVISGCSDPTATPSEDNEKQEQAATTAPAPETSEEANPFKKFNPPIEMSTLYAIDEANTFPAGDNAENNPMHQLFLDEMGIDVKAKIVTTPSSKEDKLQLAITSHDIPDFAIVNQSKLNQLIRGDMVEDLTEVYEKYASDNLREVLEQNDKKLFAPAMRDGKIYALPAPTTIYDYMPVLYIRKDWREKLGLPEPTTMDQVLDMAEKFTTGDPDGNGAQDTLGLYMNKDLNSLNYIFNAYGVYPDTSISLSNMWLKDQDGNYYNGSTDPKAKPILERLNRLYDMGAIDKEFAIKDAGKANEFIASNKIGIYFGLFFSPLSPLVDSVKNNPNAEWEALSVPAAEGQGSFIPGAPYNAYGWVYVKKGFEHPEALVTMMNYISDGYGAPWLVKDGPTSFQQGYEKVASDPKYANKGLNNWMPLQIAGNINWGPIFKEAYEKGDKEGPAAKRADYKRMFQEGIDGWGWKKTYLEAYLKTEYESVRYPDYSGPPTETLSKTESILNKEKTEAYIAFIMGARPLEEFGDFVETFNKLGGSKIASEMIAFEQE
ncbi:putative aldouronate transport system substrate-binding protein [Paenibacillus phyllosphaerae]|uniref:Putative aldouronate transport system substrate-binding protein n=1 Tax=Paenibacillus phyllosphaerae TaxID=274593 RepID=A0A7W5B131_9BACL|nr:extracellular solute-binding protein [Paenibacillus phyllosphaerae]MBB3111756.1 putative aldouronate transport system substrate-binding protein [Paenibacillus phyllosphaerae]